MRSAPFPWIALAAYGVLLAAPRINRWIDRPPRSKPEPPVVHETPTQVRIIRRPTSRELEQRGDR